MTLQQLTTFCFPNTPRSCYIT